MKKLNNLSYGIFNTVQNAVFPLITLPYVLQTLGPELYGKNLHAALFHHIFTFLFVLAIQPYALRLFSHAIGEDKKEEQDVFARIVSFQFVMSFVAALTQLFVISILGLLTPLYALYTCITLFSFMNVEWLFQAKQDYRTIFFRTLFVRMLVFGALFFFVKNERDFYHYNLIMAFNFIMPAIISFILAMRHYDFRFQILNIKKDILGARFFYANGAIGSVYAYLDQIIIGLFVTKAELAILNLIKTLASAIMSIPNMVNRFIMPDAFKAFKVDDLFSHHKKYFTLMLLCLAIGLSMFCFFGLSVINLLWGMSVDFKQYHILLIAISVSCTSIAVYIDMQASIILGLEKITTISNATVAIISPTIAIVLFNKFGYLSPFIGFTIGEFIGVLIMVFLHVFLFKTNFTQRYTSKTVDN